ncbi:MAG: hypothetical protein AMJ65_13085, partial [Phycisphaerae bacterium SG8_4]
MLSRIDLPIRRFVLLSVDLVGAETDGVLLPIRPPMREVLADDVPTLEVLPELAAGCLRPVGVEGLLAPIVLVRVEREILLELERLLELAAGCFAAVETDGLSILIELLVYVLEPEGERSILIDRLADEEADGVLVLMELPTRALLAGPIRMLELLLTEVEPVE